MKTRVTWMLSVAVLLGLAACAHRVPTPGPGAPGAAGPRTGKTLDYSTLVRRIPGRDMDTVRVIGMARNVSGRTMEMCCCFDFHGRFVAAPGCAGERPPVLQLLGRATPPDLPLNCRPVKLRPNEVFRDSLDFEVYRPDFARCPGSVRVTLSFWTGAPGQTFAQAHCVAPEAVGASISLP